ncbi:MAG: hypothetical protein M0Z76_08975 [Gammaproteobacteria bacterium]|nr:hypothetical protein [Gammaproteobacteria bacterium]
MRAECPHGLVAARLSGTIPVMTEDDKSCRLGARGWMHRCWGRGRYYPAGLPPEWRYTFYSHRQSSVLIPASALRTPDFLAVWRDETPPGFQPVLELPMARLHEDLPPVAEDADWLGGYLVRASRGLSAGDIRRLAAVSRSMPVAVDVIRGRARAAAALAAEGIGLCGRPVQGLPAQGPFVVSLLGACDRMTLRAVLQALSATRAPSGCALFFTDPQTALTQIQEARLLQDLLPAQVPG